MKESITKIKFEKAFIPLPKDAYTKVIIAGKTTELRTLQHKPNMSGLQKTRRISRNSFICLDTGEVQKYKEVSDRAGNPHLQETLKKIKLYINANFFDGGQFLTVTYKGVMTDIKRAKMDFSCFLRKLNRRYKDIMYIWILEPKASGSWHYHMLVKQAEITETELTELWEHGSTDIQDIYDVKGLARYLSPSYIKMCETDNTDVTDMNMRENDGICILSKSKEKAARLKFYPPGVRIYGKTNNIKAWEMHTTSRGAAEKYVEGKRKIGEYSMVVIDTKTEQKFNQVNIEYYDN